MALANIDLNAIGLAQQSDASRRLALYFRDNMAPMIYCLPSEPKYLKSFATIAAQDASAEGYDDGHLFSFHVISSFLLGISWYRDPVFKPILAILNDPGMDLDTRIQLAMSTSIAMRKAWIKVLPELHANTLELFNSTAHMLPSVEMNSYFKKLVALRRLRDDTDDDQLRHCLENDFRQLRGLPLISLAIDTLTPGERWARKNMGMSTKPVTDTCADLTEAQRYRLLVHWHLSLSFGRFYRINPLHKPLHQALNSASPSDSSAFSAALSQFIHMHNKRLAEFDHE